MKKEKMSPELKNIIRILLVEDSPLSCKVITDILNANPNFIVACRTHNGKEAVEVVPKIKPDIIIMSINIPSPNDFDSIQSIMSKNPTPILVISSPFSKDAKSNVFKAISYGALDVIEKGQTETPANDIFKKELISKVVLLSKIKVIRHIMPQIPAPQQGIDYTKDSCRNAANRIVAIVSSTGGPAALLEILKNIPKNFPCAIVIVQHIASGFVEGLIEWLKERCLITIKTAENSETILPGTAYIAPCDLQMRVDERQIRLIHDSANNNDFQPSGDVLLESVARNYKKEAIGVILTGMGRDGAAGMKLVKDMGGLTIAQDEKSCVVYGMPKAAIDEGAIDKILPIEKICEEIVKSI